jgi:hypothetical protein
MPPALDGEPFQFFDIPSISISISTTLQEMVSTAKPTTFLSPSPSSSPDYSHTTRRDEDFSTKKRKVNSIIDLERDEIASGAVASVIYIISSDPRQGGKGHDLINHGPLDSRRRLGTAKDSGNSAGSGWDQTINGGDGSPHSRRKILSSASDKHTRPMNDHDAVIAPSRIIIDSDSDSVVLVPHGTDIRTTIQAVVPQHKPLPTITPFSNVRSRIPIDLTSGEDFSENRISTKSRSTIHNHKRLANQSWKPASKRQEHGKNIDRKPPDSGSSDGEDELARPGTALMQHFGRRKANQAVRGIKCAVIQIFTQSDSFLDLDSPNPWTLCQYDNGVVEFFTQEKKRFPILKIMPEHIEYIQRRTQSGKLVIGMKAGRGFNGHSRIFLQLPVVKESYIPMADKAMVISDRLVRQNPEITLNQPRM